MTETGLVKLGDSGFSPSNLAEAMEFSKILSDSSLVPASFKGKPGDVLVAIQYGREIGLAPMQSLQNVACINGKPSIYGDAAMALCRASGLAEYIAETVEGEGEDMVAFCRAKRRGQDAVVESRFSVDDAKRAHLWGKAGPWTQYPSRMLQLRARGFCLRDAFPDVLKGLITVEEAKDYPTTEVVEPAEKKPVAQVTGGEDAEHKPVPKSEPVKPPQRKPKVPLQPAAKPEEPAPAPVAEAKPEEVPAPQPVPVEKPKKPLAPIGPPDANKISPSQVQLLHVALKNTTTTEKQPKEPWTPEEGKELIGKWGYTSSKDIDRKHFEEILSILRDYSPKAGLRMASALIAMVKPQTSAGIDRNPWTRAELQQVIQRWNVKSIGELSDPDFADLMSCVKDFSASDVL